MVHNVGVGSQGACPISGSRRQSAGVLHGVASATNTLWARPCLSVCLSVATTALLVTFVHEQREVTAAKRSSAAAVVWGHISARVTLDAVMTSDRSSATTTYAMLREEHLWNISILQRVHIPNLVITNNSIFDSYLQRECNINIISNVLFFVTEFNDLRSGGNIMYHLLQQTITLHFGHGVYVRISYFSQNEQWLFPSTALTKWPL
jgi:hypothetical protein